MSGTINSRIIDGDGHITEDEPAIIHLAFERMLKKNNA